MRTRVLFCVCLAVSYFSPVSLRAQAALGLGANAGGSYTSTGDALNANTYLPEAHKNLNGRVSSSKGGPLAKAAVEITNNAGTPFQYVVTDKDGDFHVEFFLYDVSMGKHFVALIKVTRKGFQVGHKIVQMDEKTNQLSFAITMRPAEPEDPNSLSQADLINGLVPRLRQVGLADGLVAKAQKDYARGVQEFLDGTHLDKAVTDLAKAASLSPLCLKCRTMLGLAELSWGDYDDARREFGESVNAIIKDQKVGSPEPLLAYGTLISWKHDPAKASAYFLDALTYAPEDPLVLQELGRSQCQELNWYSANLTLKKALAAGAGPEARLMRAEALLYAGTAKDSTDELNLYLNGRDLRNMPPRVRALEAHIQERKKDEVTFRAAAAKAQAKGIEPLDYLHHPPQNLPDFEAIGDQGLLKDILAVVGKNVSDLFTGLPNICSVEKVQQEKLNRDGKSSASLESKYRYLAMAPSHPWGPSIDEYRADWQGKESPQMGLSENTMLTEGFVSAPLVFHPTYQNGSTFRLLGRQKVKGRNTYVIAYAQDPTKSRLSGSFTFGNTTRTTYTQGLAWIDMENYEILRIFSDLLNPLPQVRLNKETTDIKFSAVQFKQVTQKFWLPEAVTVTLDWNGRVYRNSHAYSDFLVSNVEATQKIGKPKEKQMAPKDGLEPAPEDNPARPN